MTVSSKIYVKHFSTYVWEASENMVFTYVWEASENMVFTYVWEASENMVGKGENAGDQHFLLFPPCFPSYHGQKS